MRCLFQQIGEPMKSADVVIERGCARVRAHNRVRRQIYSMTDVQEFALRRGEYVMLYEGCMLKNMDVPIA